MATSIEQEHSEGPSEHDHSWTIVVNNQPFTTEQKELTGEAVKALAGLPPDYELFVVRGTNSVPLANDEVVHLHQKEEFRAIPAGTFG